MKFDLLELVAIRQLSNPDCSRSYMNGNAGRRLWGVELVDPTPRQRVGRTGRERVLGGYKGVEVVQGGCHRCALRDRSFMRDS